MSFAEYYKELGSKITVESIMTPIDEFYFCDETTNKTTLHNTLVSEQYDQAPFEDPSSSKRIKGYILRHELKEELDSPKPLGDMCHTLDYPSLITYSTPLVTALKKIIEPKFLFVLKDNDVCGLITYADFDKRPMRLHIYLLIGEFESNLLFVMKKTHDDAYWVDKLEPSSRGTILHHFERRKEIDRSLRKVECFGLPDIFQAFTDESELREKLGLGRYDYDSLKDRLVSLRHEVSHQGLDIALEPRELEELLETKANLIHLVKTSEELRKNVAKTKSSENVSQSLSH